MLIRGKILLGCLCLTLLTAGVGLFDMHAERTLGALAARIYDQTFMSMSYLRSAQNSFAIATGSHSLDPNTASSIVSDLQVARQRATTSKAAAASANLIASVSRLGYAQALAPKVWLDRATAIEQDFDTAVEIYAGDGFVHRRTVDSMVSSTVRDTLMAIAVSLGVALAITGLLARSIVPRLHRAFAVAQNIAAGHLDNRIEASGLDETAALLRALGTMQDSISEKILRINTLMEEQSASHASEIAIRSARFAAALENMTQGLCLFDVHDRLIVANRRFGELFGRPQMGAEATDVFATAGIPAQAPQAADGQPPVESFVFELQDGRSIALSQQRMAGGGFVATFEDLTERREAEARLAHMARHDTLTGLPNRAMLREHVTGLLARARRGEPCAAIVLDLDQFKGVNDVFGHQAGDRVIQELAGRLRRMTRETDVVARLDGDEFVILQPGVPQPDHATALATRILDTLAVPFEIDGQKIQMAASLGIVVASGGLDDPDSLLKNAELALYRAKAEGRGTYRFFDPEMDRRIRERRELELDLRLALTAGEFEVFYQPLIAAGTAAIQGFEALIRWRHPRRGMVSPALFVPLAEEIGLIAAIGEWVLREACMQASRWPDGVKIAVNLSPLQFRNRNLASTVADALAVSGLPARRLELEITESLMLQDNETVLTILHEIRALGVSISMDDFGTGYSSLSYLQRFPFDKIKIDQSFVRGLGGRSDCLAIIRAVIGLGRSMGMSVIAEGVETQEQRALLEAEGCRQMQGYLFSVPRPKQDIAKMLGLPDTLQDRAA